MTADKPTRFFPPSKICPKCELDLTEPDFNLASVFKSGSKFKPTIVSYVSQYCETRIEINKSGHTAVCIAGLIFHPVYALSRPAGIDSLIRFAVTRRSRGREACRRGGGEEAKRLRENPRYFSCISFRLFVFDPPCTDGLRTGG